MTAPGFTGVAIDRADHLRLDAAAVAALARDPAARLLLLDGHDPMLDGEGRLQWTAMPVDAGATIFLGLARGSPRFAAIVPVCAGGSAFGLFRAIAAMDATDAALWGMARSLIEWHARNGFCAACGAATTVVRAGWGRTCAGCGAEHFPRVDPVVIMLAEHRGKVLLGRQPHFPAGRYSALAGFVEPGESIEEAVARELHEEAGVAASGVRYVASQPWPFPGSLMIGCIAAADSFDLIVDAKELDDAIWVDEAGVRAALAGTAGAPFLTPPPYAIANTLLRRWLAERDALAAIPGRP